MNERVLVILPHPDDESFGAAGLIAHNRKKGIPVTYACLTLGEMGRNMGNPLFANRENLRDIRKKELIDACNVLDITDLKMMGFRDKTLEFEDDEEFADTMENLILEVNPSLIVTFYPGFSVHPDHDATGAAVIRALKRFPKEKRPLTYCVAFSNNCEDYIGKPDVEVNIIDVADIKLKAMKAHRSQTETMMKTMEEKFLNKDPEVAQWTELEVYWTYKWDD